MRALASIRATALAAALIGAAACQRRSPPALETAPEPGPLSDTAAPAPPPRVPRGNRDVISQAEISAATGAQDAYDVIRQLRPIYLAHRGQSSLRATAPPRALVYVDEVRVGGIEWLRNIPRGEIAEIRYYSGLDATTRWGTGHGSGVIHVSTKH